MGVGATRISLPPPPEEGEKAAVEVEAAASGPVPSVEGEEGEISEG